jgi:hypothetical protein
VTALNAQDVANILWGMAELRITPPEHLMLGLLIEAQLKLDAMSPQVGLLLECTCMTPA